jgi:hypothetical protein
VSEDVGVRENGVKMHVFESILLHVQGFNFGKGVYELENHVG